MTDKEILEFLKNLKYTPLKHAPGNWLEMRINEDDYYKLENIITNLNNNLDEDELVKKGSKVTCNRQLWQGKIGRVIEIEYEKDVNGEVIDICWVAFGDFEMDIPLDEVKIFKSEFINKDKGE